MKTKKKIIIVLSIIIIALITIATLLFSGVININDNEPIVEENVQEEVIEEPKQEYRDIWLENKNINSDYVGELVFDSGLIHQPFVQAKFVYDKNGDLYHFYTERGELVSDGQDYTGNDVYIWTNWKDMTYDYNILGGSVFMDYRNVLSNQNIIIYGHHFSESAGNDPERVKAFTPLEKLLKAENYEDNKSLKLILDNETRFYELAGTYIFDATDDFYINNMQYYRTNYNYDEFNDVADDNYFKGYIDGLNNVKLYDTDCSLSEDDNTLTLQTCISGQDGVLYEICVFKETETEYYN